MPLSTSIVVRLQHQQESIAELIEEFTDEQLKETVRSGKWSVFQNVVHLAAYQPTFIHRMALILQEKKPLFVRYVAEEDPVFFAYMNKSLPELLQDISEKRAVICNELLNLPDEQLSLQGIHPKFGIFSLAKWTDFFLLHEAHHLWTIMQLTAALKEATPQ